MIKKDCMWYEGMKDNDTGIIDCTQVPDRTNCKHCSFYRASPIFGYTYTMPNGAERRIDIKEQTEERADVRAIALLNDLGVITRLGKQIPSEEAKNINVQVMETEQMIEFVDSFVKQWRSFLDDDELDGMKGLRARLVRKKVALERIDKVGPSDES